MTLLRRHGLWLIVAMLVGVAGVLLVYQTRAVQYTSTSQVDVEAHVVALTTPVVPNMGTEAQVATSGVVLSGTARSLGMPVDRLDSALSAKVSGTANILSISCTLPAPGIAQRCAAAAAAAYTAFRNDVTASKTEQAHDPLQVTLVTVASLPTAPAGPGKKILVPIGAFIGLLLGLGGVVVREHFDVRVRDRADLERCLDAPVLAEVPRIRRRSVNPAFAFAQAPLSIAAESYRYLRAHLEPLIADTPGGVAVLLVTGARPREGRTSVAANLAAALAHAGDTVLLVDADLRNPALDRLFETGERPGLTDLLAGRASLEEVAVPTDVPGLRLVTAGIAPAGADALEPVRLSRAAARMRTIANVIVIDSAPVLAVSDAVTLARVSDMVLMVADVRRTGRHQATAAAQQIQTAGPQIVIGVLNCVPRPFLSGRTRNLSAEPGSLAPTSQAATILARTVPPRGQNGQGRPGIEATQPARRQPGVVTDPDDPSRPGQGSE
jgi:polysaccharide biosynthesis transport protein